MMTDDIKDDYELEYFSMGEGMTSAQLDAFVHENKDGFYSKDLAEHVEGLPNKADGLTKTGVYKNDERDRWEYWAILPATQTQGRYVPPSYNFVSYCMYSENLLGFNKWTQEMDYYLVQRNYYPVPLNKLN